MILRGRGPVVAPVDAVTRVTEAGKDVGLLVQDRVHPQGVDLRLLQGAHDPQGALEHRDGVEELDRPRPHALFQEVLHHRDETAARCVHRVREEQVLVLEAVQVEVRAVEVQHVLHVALFLRIVPGNLEKSKGGDVAAGGVLLDLLRHDDRRQERSPEHDAHHRILDHLVHVGDLVHGKVLHGQRDRRADDEVVLLLPGSRPEREIEEQLVGALGVVDELGMLRADVTELRDQPRDLAVHFPGRREGVHVHAFLARHDLLHGVPHLVEQRDEVLGGLVVPGRARFVGQHGEQLQRLRECSIHAVEGDLVLGLEVPVEILRLQYHLCHAATLHPGPGSGQSKACGSTVPSQMVRRRFVFRGTVQGVGFRPASTGWRFPWG